MTKSLLNPLFLAAALGTAMPTFAQDAGVNIKLDPIPAHFPADTVTLPSLAGDLKCAPGLCTTVASRATDPKGGPDTSKHIVRLKSGAAATTLSCWEGLSDDAGCQVGNRSISGEHFFAPGDSCLYVHQAGLSYFPLTKKYCLSGKGQLERVSLNPYPVNIEMVSKGAIPLLASLDSKTVSGSIAKGRKFTVLAAEVNESADVDQKVKWYLVRDGQGDKGWASPKLVAHPACESEDNARELCFHGD